jgi:hypothetical protein
MVAPGAWSPGFSWFDLHHSQWLTAAFPGFMALLTDPIWEKPLSEAIYWCTNAGNRGGTIATDVGLIISQAALELLSWTYCVKHRKLVSARAFDKGKLAAADKLRMLLSSLGIPTEIPSVLEALRADPKPRWADIPDAVTMIRNSLVHPDSKRPSSEGAYTEAWSLALWCIELVVLKLCNYNGKYANRISARFVGEAEDVPSSKAT